MGGRAAELLLPDVFFVIDNGEHVPWRKDISAIMLGSIRWDAASFVGLLHPEPEYPFNIELLPMVPFVGLNSHSQIEWYQKQPHGFGYRHYYPECVNPSPNSDFEKEIL